jgi:hypothetical protein
MTTQTEEFVISFNKNVEDYMHDKGTFKFTTTGERSDCNIQFNILKDYIRCTKDRTYFQY